MANSEKTGTRNLFWLTFLRIVLGLILLGQGIRFLSDTTIAKDLIEQTGIGTFSQNSVVLAFIISYLSLFCGVCITVGLFTRIASIIQLPILIVAVFFVEAKAIGSNTFSLLLAIVTLLLLIIFAIKGSGQLSADKYFTRGSALD
ncbi:MAG TPA: DoxX family protein [Chitinophagaceae bacterium]|nr:DoxX family protein [Chitinophagaceae bacterium]